MQRVSALGTALLLIATAAHADVVYDRAGGTTKGLVVEEHWDRLVISTEEGEKTVLRGDIEEVFYSEPERNYLYLGSQAMEDGEFSAAEGFLERALQFNPQLKEAEDALLHLRDLQRKAEWAGLTQDPLKQLEKGWGLSLQKGEVLVKVQAVKTSPGPENAVLAPGDGLVAVWSSSLAFLPEERVARELLGPPGTLVKLTIEREVWLPPAAAGERVWPGVKLGMERLGLSVQGLQGPPVPTGSPAVQRLLVGDRIVQIDGESTRYTPLAKTRSRIEQAKGRGVTLRIHRDLVLIRP